MTEHPESRKKTTNVAIIILAAGKSSRMRGPGHHKLLAEFEGVPLIRRVATAASNCDCSEVIVVTGYREEDIEAAVAELGVTVAHNTDYQSGMASSIILGVSAAEALTPVPDGILIALADMPFIGVSAFNTLLSHFNEANCHSIVRATAEALPGHPVIIPRSLYGSLKTLSGDAGAKAILNHSAIPIIEVDIGPIARIDVDTPEQMVAAGGVLR